MSTEQDNERMSELRGLRLDREPERDLWPGVERRIAPRRRTPWLGYALAASIVAAVVVGTWRESPPQVPTTVAVQARTAGQVAPQQQALLKANLAIVKDAENQLQHALEQDPDSESLRRLQESMQQRRGQLKSRLAHHAQET